jgi:hypothetical protein
MLEMAIEYDPSTQNNVRRILFVSEPQSKRNFRRRYLTSTLQTEASSRCSDLIAEVTCPRKSNQTLKERQPGDAGDGY